MVKVLHGDTVKVAQAIGRIERGEFYADFDLSSEDLGHLRRMHDHHSGLVEAVEAVHSWLVCAPISTPNEMAESFAEMEEKLRSVCPSMN